MLYPSTASLVPYQPRLTVAESLAAMATSPPGVPSASVLAPSPTTNTDVAASLIVRHLEIVKRVRRQIAQNHRSLVRPGAGHRIQPIIPPIPACPGRPNLKPALVVAVCQPNLTSMLLSLSGVIVISLGAGKFVTDHSSFVVSELPAFIATDSHAPVVN